MNTTAYNRPTRPRAVDAPAFTFFVCPIFFIPLFSFNSGLYPRFPLEGFTFNWYAKLRGRGPVFAALQNSLQARQYPGGPQMLHLGIAGRAAAPGQAVWLTWKTDAMLVIYAELQWIFGD